MHSHSLNATTIAKTNPLSTAAGLLLRSSWTIALTLIAVVLFASSSMTEWLQFDRIAVSQGEWWRVLTGHLTHWNADHLFWDAIMFAAIGIFCERKNATRFLVCTAGSMLAISAALWVIIPDMEFYRGLSGVDSALFILAVTFVLREAYSQREWRSMAVAIALGAGFCGKVAFEAVTGMTLFVDSSAAGFTPIPLAHGVGAIVGVIVGLFPQFARPEGRQMS
jgi:rhomboid family GlyGly-CTERM serine protease